MEASVCQLYKHTDGECAAVVENDAEVIALNIHRQHADYYIVAMGRRRCDEHQSSLSESSSSVASVELVVVLTCSLLVPCLAGLLL